jgi:hypothetical protein
LPRSSSRSVKAPHTPILVWSLLKIRETKGQTDLEDSNTYLFVTDADGRHRNGGPMVDASISPCLSLLAIPPPCQPRQPRRLHPKPLPRSRGQINPSASTTAGISEEDPIHATAAAGVLRSISDSSLIAALEPMPHAPHILSNLSTSPLQRHPLIPDPAATKYVRKKEKKRRGKSRRPRKTKWHTVFQRG